MPTVLVIDDDRSVLRLVGKALSEADVEVLTASTAEEGLAAVRQHQPDTVLLDIQLPDASGLEIVTQIHSFDAKLPVVFITVSDNSETAIEAMRLGAYDFLLKPLDIGQVQDIVERTLNTRRMMQVPVTLANSEAHEVYDTEDQMLGRSPPMLEVYKEIGRVASQDVTVLISGESGTGKELVARAIYQHSERRERPFLAVNCAALSETLLESELFGHEKGAFTGADRRRIGKFEQSTGGTIFLDEVGDMSPLVQSKVLRLLQEQRFERVGGTDTIETDARIISATNRDLERMIDDGEFRLDLFHRLNGYRIDLPPLRERGDDVALLIQHCLHQLSRQLRKDVTSVSAEALQLLLSHRWPGNIRELQTVLRKAVLKATGPVLVPEFLPESVFVSKHPVDAPVGSSMLPPAELAVFVDRQLAVGSNNMYAETIEMTERYLITRVLRETKGHQSKAAEFLGISRGSLRNKIRTLGILIERVVQTSE
ncbi:MAG: sigma-54-dependent Fis family transcriptional regulator [Planctomycetia bacterium]|nr:sigma-54-dependent Fis family transcriptional regulator [Planctomycetia bacterium]